MTLEDRVREHLDAAGRRLTPPPGSFERVRRRGRRRRAVRGGVAALALVAVVVAVPVALGGLARDDVEFDPVAPPWQPTPSPAPTDEPGRARVDEDAVGTVAVAELGAAVLAYGPGDRDVLRLVDGDDQRVLWPAPVAVALPDGRGGVLLQPGTEATLVWLPDVEEDAHTVLAEVDGDLLLRGVLPDGRALYSVRDDAGTAGEDDAEEFFAVALTEDAEPEPIATRPAYESWHVGPATVAGGGSVHAGCHLHCSLWPGLADPPDGAGALYHGGGAQAGPSAAIEGLTATADGAVLGFVEVDITFPEADEPELVLLDGASFEVLARVGLPRDARHLGEATVSLSGDGQRVLVGLGGRPTGQPPPSVPTAAYLVDDALSDEPTVRRVDVDGALRWFDPEAAAGPGRP